MTETINVADIQSRLAIATEALRKAEERATAGQLALEVIHEIQNPLQALQHITFLARAEARYPTRVRKYLQMADEQLATLGQITSQTLGFARHSQTSRPIDFAALAEAALRIHQRKIEAKQVHLIRDLPRNAVAEVHTGEMLQVVSNLIVNALDALPTSGILCLRVRKLRGRLRFSIADNGPGIPAEYAREIFQPFFTTKQENGTGLGLAVSKRIVERHDGVIRMRSSVRPGKSGTVFHISLPP
jgi:signal transduction histidine kinase